MADTLGARIMDAADAFSRACERMSHASLSTIAEPRADAEAARAKLRDLAARADAAERLAVVVEWCDDDGWEFASDRYNQYHEALAAWRAITEEAQP